MNWLFLLPQESQDELYLHIAKLHGKEEDLDYGRLAFHNEEDHSATHSQRIVVLRECFEKKCTQESDDGSPSVYSSSRSYRSTRQLSDYIQA